MRSIRLALHVALVVSLISCQQQQHTCASALTTPSYLFALCTDALTCDQYSDLAAFYILGTMQVDRGSPDDTSSSTIPSARKLAAPPANSIPTYVLYLTDQPDASSSLFFSIVAGVELAMQRTNTTAQQTMMVIQASLVTVAIQASSHLSIPYIVISSVPLPEVVTVNLEAQMVSAALANPLCRAVIQYALGGMAYVVGAVSSEMSTTGNVALMTGPFREPYVTYHAYVREGFASHCPACLLSGLYLSSQIVENATLLTEVIIDSGLIRSASIDVILMAVEFDVLLGVRTLLRSTYNVTNVTVLCVQMQRWSHQITFQAAPVFSAIVTAFNLAPSLPALQVTFSLESSVGVSVQTLCSTCISERALRTYADTTTALTTIYDTYGVNGTQTLLKLPMWGELQEVSFDGNRLIDLSSSTSSVASSSAPLWRPRLYRFSVDPFEVVPDTPFLTVAVGTSCELMEQLQLSGLSDVTECIGVVVCSRLSHLMLLAGGVTEWVAPQLQILPQASLTTWLAQSSDNVLPDCCFSVDAIDQTTFLVFGGEHATTLLPQTLNTMFLLTIPDASASVSNIKLSLDRVISATQASSLPAPRADHAHSFYLSSDGIRKLFIHGGRGDGGAILQDLWCYNIVDQTWSQLSASSTTRYLHKLVLSRRIGGDDIMVAWGGENLVPLQTLEQYSIQRNTWYPSVALPIRSTTCVASVGPLHLAFLEASKLSPCILDVVTLSYQCTTGNVASLMASTLSNAQLMCGSMKSAQNPLERVGLLVVPDTAVSSVSLALVVIPQTVCPPPYVLQTSNVTVSSSTPSPLSIATPPTATLAPPSSAYTPAEYQTICAANCPSQTFPFLAVCWPCSNKAKTNAVGLLRGASSVQLSPLAYSWTNLTVSVSSADYIAYSTAATASLVSACAPRSAAGKSEQHAQDVFVIAATACVVVIGSASLGYLVWLVRSRTFADKEFSCAPIAPPVTFILVDVHSSATLWKTDPTFHAKYLDILSVVTSEAIQHCQLYRVRRVGDAGYLIACSNVQEAIRFVQVLRQRLYAKVLDEVKTSPDSAARYAAAFISRTSNGDAISRKSLAAVIVDTTKFAVHSTSCISIRRTRHHSGKHRGSGNGAGAANNSNSSGGLESVEYDGEEVFITPSAATHCTKRGEISFTLDAVAELAKFHKESIADGEHLKVGRRDTEYSGVTLANILSMLGAPAVGGGLIGTSELQGSAVVSSQLNNTEQQQEPPNSSASPAAHSSVIHRACLNGTHIRVLKLKMLEPPRSSSNDKNCVADECGATVDPPRPGGNTSSANEDSALYLAGVASQSNDGFPSRSGGGNLVAGDASTQQVHLDVNGVSGEAAVVAGGGGVDHFGNDALMLQLDALYDYLDIGIAHPAVLSREDFSAMRTLIGFVLCSAINSLEDDQAQEQVMNELSKAFALSDSVRRSGAEELLLNSPEGRKLVFFEHLAARVLQGLEPLRVKRYLAHCTAAGKAAAALGVGDFSSTAAAGGTQ
ncbi:Hypothetical protein, putative [Bodo saltans]|uniref:ATP pyrophosphate-lyase n=1 Tax=Bodo saltans TaxID=75058 RepID=A0A0S4JS16_BODSA|nr:Hypothetical protein, putative [Bodo saltans]|eukprot:CUG92116.1 Hypothetical protein, putative [Bodo saltans]